MPLGNQKSTKWILGILIGLIILALGFGLGYFLLKRSEKKETATTTPATNTSPKTTTVPEETAQNGAGWKIFKNFAESYLIEYPADATVVNADNPAAPTNGAKCVKISTKYVWVIIAAKDIPDTIDCLNTGFGTDWSNAPDETVTAAGPTYTAKGMKTEAASAGYYRDDYMITVASGEKIEYGISVNEKYDDAMTSNRRKFFSGRVNKISFNKKSALSG